MVHRSNRRALCGGRKEFREKVFAGLSSGSKALTTLARGRPPLPVGGASLSAKSGFRLKAYSPRFETPSWSGSTCGSTDERIQKLLRGENTRSPCGEGLAGRRGADREIRGFDCETSQRHRSQIHRMHIFCGHSFCIREDENKLRTDRRVSGELIRHNPFLCHASLDDRVQICESDPTIISAKRDWIAEEKICVGDSSVLVGVSIQMRGDDAR